MKAIKKEINEYIKESKDKYEIETTYIYPGVTKNDLKEFRKRDKRWFRRSIFKSILKGIWSLFPLTLFILIIARIAIVVATVTYLESQGDLLWIIRLCLVLWCFLPFRGLLYNLYYGFKDFRNAVKDEEVKRE